MLSNWGFKSLHYESKLHFERMLKTSIFMSMHVKHKISIGSLRTLQERHIKGFSYLFNPFFLVGFLNLHNLGLFKKVFEYAIHLFFFISSVEVNTIWLIHSNCSIASITTFYQSKSVRSWFHRVWKDEKNAYLLLIVWRPQAESHLCIYRSAKLYLVHSRSPSVVFLK